MHNLDRLLVREIARATTRRDALPEAERGPLEAELRFLRDLATENVILNEYDPILRLLKVGVALDISRLGVRLGNINGEAVLASFGDDHLLSPAPPLDREGVKAAIDMIRDRATEIMSLPKAEVLANPEYRWLWARWSITPAGRPDEVPTQGLSPAGRSPKLSQNTNAKHPGFLHWLRSAE